MSLQTTSGDFCFYVAAGLGEEDRISRVAAGEYCGCVGARVGQPGFILFR